MFEPIPLIAILTPESSADVPTCIFGTKFDKSEILAIPCVFNCSCETTETAIGVSIRFVSRLVAVTITSSIASSAASCAKVLLVILANEITSNDNKYLLIKFMVSPQLL